jgi:hypothetical protein
MAVASVTTQQSPTLPTRRDVTGISRRHVAYASNGRRIDAEGQGCLNRAMAEAGGYPIPSGDQVIVALDTTGFILEQRIAREFARHNFNVAVSYAFEDPETGKSREVDILATRTNWDWDDEIVGPLLACEVLVECKNTQNPFVLIGSTDHGNRLSTYSYFRSEFDPLTLGFSGAISTHYHLGLWELPGSPNNETFAGNQLVRMNRQAGKWKADNSGVFDSIFYPLAKAFQVISERHQPPQVTGEDPSLPSFAIVYPLLVTRGPVFTVDVRADEPTVEQVPWAMLVRDLDESNLKGTYAITVVQFEHLSRFIEERIGRYFDAIEEKLSSNQHLFEPQWLVDKFGTPERLDIFEKWARNTSR